MRSDPLVRVEVDGLKATITQMLILRAAEMEKAVKDALEEVVNERAIKNQIAETVRAAIVKHAENYFSYGEGAKMIREALELSFKSKAGALSDD